MSGAAHAHNVAAFDGNREHLTGHEYSRQAQEYSPGILDQPHAATSGHSMVTFEHDEIAAHSARLGDDARIALYDGEVPNATLYERNFGLFHLSCARQQGFWRG